ncbi:hypothetical protein [Mycobacteroides abscessus]|uniref:hypothetical protein n=1 Tax=Mycobacteroides abscessus TaxID=36809 RepID=UPI0018967A50|nr:hypothetical protein [Mycobacteroides abscessus]MDO3096801.1 hypothetical protein [Mycobacteroides abscessus subsp. abscessus]
MAKGKYGARAANRIVQTDNDLLKEKVAECEALKAELNSVKQRLNLSETATSAEVTRRAEKAAAGLVNAMKIELSDKLEADNAERLRASRLVAGRLWDYFVGTDGSGSIPQFFITDIIPLLLPMDRDANEFMGEKLDDFGGNRNARRRGMKNIRSHSSRDWTGATALLTAARLGDKEALQKVRQIMSREEN